LKTILDILTNSPEETRASARRLAGELSPGAVLALHGDLGSGKTCFVQGLAEALGVQTIVNSPTFTIINEYRGRYPLYHVDLYRLNSASEAEEIGLEEFIKGDGVAAIEWPEKICQLLPEGAIHVFFEFLDMNRRRIVIKT
jgi:tRNA threonylcarbamoyladenosine biosynthesis protein TsaE